MRSFMHSILLLFFSLLVGCSKENAPREIKEWNAQNGKLKVLSTTAMIDDMVKRIGAHLIDTLVLIKGELDPHSYELVKGDDEKLKTADLIFYNGLGLEHGPSLRQYLQKSPKAIGLGDLIYKTSPVEIILVGSMPDPHIWMDISLWMRTIDPIVEALSRLRPDDAKEFQENGRQLKEKMESANEDIYLLLQSIPENKRYLITSHDAFNYFTRAYLASDDDSDEEWRIRFQAPEGLAPESQISASDIQAIIDHVQKYEIHVLFAESNVSKDSLRKIVSAAKEKGMDIRIAKEPLYGDAMGPPGSFGDTYLEMISHDAITIARYIMQ